MNTCTYHDLFVGVAMRVIFGFISDKESMDVIFSLNCTSTGGSADSVVWTRDGFVLRNTGPLVLTNESTLSYTSVLLVSGRTPGTYTCTVRGDSDQILNSTNFTVQGIILYIYVLPMQIQCSSSDV